MSYQEKRTIASIMSGIAVLAAYCIYVFGRYRAHAADPNDLKSCAVTILIFIGVGVAATIVMQILLHIALSVGIAIKTGGCDDTTIEKEIGYAAADDEMDKLIELKAMKLGFVICGAGFIAALVAAVCNVPAAVMLHILFLSFSLGSLAEGALSLYYYRRGIKNA